MSSSHNINLNSRIRPEDLASIRDFRTIRDRCKAVETTMICYDVTNGNEYLKSGKELLDLDPAPGIVRMENVDADTWNNGLIDRDGLCPSGMVFSAELRRECEGERDKMDTLEVEFHDPSSRNSTQLRHERQGSIDHFSEVTICFQSKIKDVEYTYNPSSGTITVIDKKETRKNDDVDWS